RIALGLEPIDQLLWHPQPLTGHACGGRKISAEVEELVLNSREHQGSAVDRPRPADERVQLVDLAHRLDPRIGLRDAAPAAETRLTCVTATRVDPRQTHRLVSFTAHPEVAHTRGGLI